ncbi:MAG: LysR family transcriptional regulator [Oscillospiraceae bacterium]|nr:LysR family transcriptional regulator [Oscillospiraceae bacterium]
MDFGLLKSFIAVADEKSFSTAAQHLFISQQTLSKQIAKLEEELGTHLFVRSRPLGLTPDGVNFLRTAKGIMALKQQYEDSCSKRMGNGEFVHLGIEHSIARAILPHVLPDFVDKNPGTFVKLSEASPEVLQKAVSHDAVDLVIGSIYNPPDTHETVKLCPKPMLLVVPRAIMERLAGDELENKLREFEKCAELRYFKDEPFIKTARVSSGGRALSCYLKFYDIEPKFVCELTNLENGFQLANSGMGIFLYPKFFWDMLDAELREDYLKNIYVFPLPYLAELESICAYYHKENGLTGKTRELFDSIVEFFACYEKSYMDKPLL